MTTEKPRRGLSRRSALKVPLAMAGLSIGLGAEQVGAAEPATFTKPVTIIIPFVPGTITDAVPRILAQSMGTRSEQPIVVAVVVRLGRRGAGKCAVRKPGPPVRPCNC